MKIKVPYELAMPLLGIYLKNMKDTKTLNVKGMWYHSIWRLSHTRTQVNVMKVSANNYLTENPRIPNLSYRDF